MLDISDVLSLLKRLFLDGDLELPCDGASAEDGGNLTLLDSDQSRSLDLTDAIHFLDYLFRGGPGPVAGTRCVRIEGCPDACRL